MPYRRLFLGDEPFPDTVMFQIPDAMLSEREIERFFDDHGITTYAGIFLHPDIEDSMAFLEPRKEWIGQQTRDHPGGLGAIDPDGGLHWGKIVPCRVSTEALISWMADSREANRLYGSRPDRPPDIDTDTTRSWVRHPGEPDDLGYQLSPHEKGIVESFPVFVVVHKMSIPGLDSGHIKVLVTWEQTEAGGTYRARLKAEAKDGKVIFDAETTHPDDDDDWLTDLLVATDQRLDILLDEDDVPIVSTYLDFEAHQSELDPVELELADFYGLPPNWRQLEKVGKKDAEELSTMTQAGTDMLNAMWRKEPGS